MRIALVSEHANPLAAVGGVDAGGQNVHVDALAGQLAIAGHAVTVFTRRDDEDAPVRVTAPTGYVVEHVPAGPAREIPKDGLLQHMPAFARYLEQRWTEDPVDVVHAHFWMSGIASTRAARRVGVPVLQTFHALGTVKRRNQGAADTSPTERIGFERRLCRQVDHVIATCSDEISELLALGLPASHATVIPCGVDTSVFRPGPQPATSARGDRLL
jgi:glycosyltransferase involved in cell wall biosynthesis